MEVLVEQVVLENQKYPAAPWTASPLASGTSLPVSVTNLSNYCRWRWSSRNWTSTVKGCNGKFNSIFSTITSAGGGGGGANGVASS
jgi:hypothetical protein